MYRETGKENGNYRDYREYVKTYTLGLGFGAHLGSMRRVCVDGCAALRFQQ